MKTIIMIITFLTGATIELPDYPNMATCEREAALVRQDKQYVAGVTCEASAPTVIMVRAER